MGVVVRRCIDILAIINNFPYSTCISFFLAAASLLLCSFFKCLLGLLEISRRTRWWCLKCVIVYLARDIRPFVMYCVNGKPRSSLLIESTDSMIILQWTYCDSVVSSDVRLLAVC